jgi:cyclopropane fatty-acyl-phospholipid synthase-like methyltransferase
VPDIFGSAESRTAANVMEKHFDDSMNLYKFWASPWTVVKAFTLGWERSGHPARLHYAWDLSQQPSLDEAIRQTTRETVARLELDHLPAAFIVEAGCGMGGCTTQIAQEYPHLRVLGVQLMKRQVEVAQRRKQFLDPEAASRISFFNGNNLRLPLRRQSCDGVMAIETFCHIPPGEKGKLLQGVYHLLKPGGKLVIVDGYLLREPQGPEKTIYDNFRYGWTLPEMISPEAQTTLAQNVGFAVKSVEDVTQHVTGSVEMIYRIAWLCHPFINLARFMAERQLRIPGVSWLFDYLGFSLPHASALAQTCLAQKPLAEAKVLGYFVHVFEKPGLR